MGFLDSAAVTIDATLTRLGRKRLVEGNFNIELFTLSDEGVDYTLYDINHPSGSESYGTVIENMNVLEAAPARSGFMSYLINDSLANRTFGLPVDWPPREDDSSDPAPLEADVPLTFQPNRSIGFNELYYFTIQNTKIIKFMKKVEGQEGQWIVQDGVDRIKADKAEVVTQKFSTTETDDSGNFLSYASTKVIVRGVNSGMSAILTVTVNTTPGSTNDVSETDKHALRFKGM
jgi:hypothetical protein